MARHLGKCPNRESVYLKREIRQVPVKNIFVRFPQAVDGRQWGALGPIVLCDTRFTRPCSLLLGTGFIVSSWWLFLPAVILFFIGAEIRVRVEDHLLATQFGDSFADYKSRAPAYVPFLK